MYDYISNFWEGSAYYWECHVGLRVMVPEKGDLSGPNKWRGINLMDICSKIFSSIFNNNCFKLLNNHGIKTQSGGTSNLGCHDGVFILKTLLRQLWQHNLSSYVVSVDLAKAYSTANHALLIKILELYGGPPKLCASISQLYTGTTVVRTIVKEEAKINQTIGVRQGDNLSPVSFLFIMSAVTTCQIFGNIMEQ